MMEEEKTKLKEFAGKLLEIIHTGFPKAMAIKRVKKKIDELRDEEVIKVIELIKKFNEN